MPANVKFKIGNVQVEIEGVTKAQQVFSAATVFEVLGENKCGACDGEDVTYRHRKAQEYDYYEVVCKNGECRAKLELGQQQASPNIMYAKRKDSAGNWKPNNGWEVYKPNGQQSQPAGHSSNQSVDDTPF